MPTFKDSTGAEWKVEINIGQAKRINTDLGLNLLGDLSALIRAVADNPMDLFECLRILCERQAKDAGITAEQFLERLSGDSVDAATDAFWEALRLFIPRPSAREALGQLMAKQREVVKALDVKMRGKVTAAVEAISPEQVADGILTGAESAGSPAFSGASATTSTG